MSVGDSVSGGDPVYDEDAAEQADESDVGQANRRKTRPLRQAALSAEEPARRPAVFDPSKDQLEEDGGGVKRGSLFRRSGFSSGGQITATPLLHARARREVDPVFECSACWRELPEDIEFRLPVTIGVLGTTGCGKTHFLGVTLGQAKSDQALAPFGIGGFHASTQTEKVFHQDYFVPIHLDRKAYRNTDKHLLSQKIKTPLSFTATVKDESWRLLFYDLPGESILDRLARNRELSFLHRADGLIFLIDPLGFRSVRDQLPPHVTEGALKVARKHSQVELLKAMAEEMGPEAAAQVPIAIAVTKSDLVFEAFGKIDERLRADEVVENRSRQITELSEIVETQVLPYFESPELDAAIRSFGNRTLHLIASIGSNPISSPDEPASAGTTGVIDEFKPSRGIDPLLTVLDRIRI